MVDSKTKPYKWAHLSGDPDDGFTQIDPHIRDKFNNLPEDKKAPSLAAKTFIFYPFELKLEQERTFEEKEENTIKFIENHLKEFDKPYVATSFGNDSIVLMHLVMRACKNLGKEIPDMILNDTLNTFKEEKQYWADIVKLWNLGNHYKLFKPPEDKNGNKYTVWSVAEKVGHLPSFRGIRKKKRDGTIMSRKEMGGSGGSTPECCDILKKKTLKKIMNALPEKARYNCQFIGTRAEESRMRSNSVLQRCRTYIFKHFVKYPIRTVTPLSFWLFVDIEKYYEKHNIPKNPAYKAHDMERMGCASCPAHRYWEIRLAKDPTNEGFGMLKQNFKLMKKYVDAGTEKPERLEESIKTLQKYLKKKESFEELNDKQRVQIIELLKIYTHDKTIEDFEKA